jgi:hypothetical protein
MQEAPVLYMVRSWYSPDGGEKYLQWLEEKHLGDIIATPGILWARRVDLEQVDDKGWESLLLVYGFESRKALSAYLESPIRNRFWRELQPLKDIHYSERFFGKVSGALDDRTSAQSDRTLT